MCKKTEGDVVKVKCSDFAEFIEISIFRTSCGEGLSSFEGAGRRRQDHYVPPEARIVCKSRNGGVFRRGQIGGEKEVEQGAKNTALRDARLHFVAVGARVFIPDLEVAVSEVRLQKQIVWAREGGPQFIQ